VPSISGTDSLSICDWAPTFRYEVECSAGGPTPPMIIEPEQCVLRPKMLDLRRRLRLVGALSKSRYTFVPWNFMLAEGERRAIDL
jgi:hypothetical protein